MANRGILPKFRPATLGGREARPLIRPVKPSAPPPVSPPHRFPSGFREGHGPPPSLAAARERLHALARELPRDHDESFEAETEARPERAIAASRFSPANRPEMHRARITGQMAGENAGHVVGQGERHVEHEVVPPSIPVPMGLDAPYEALPSLEAPFERQDHPRAFRSDAYASAPSEGPSTAMRGGYPLDDYADPPSYSRPETTSHGGHAGRDDGSGARQRPRKDATPVRLYDAAAYEANYPGVRREHHGTYPPPRTASYQAPRHLQQRETQQEQARESYPCHQESYEAHSRFPSVADAHHRVDDHHADETSAPRRHREESYRPAVTALPTRREESPRATPYAEPNREAIRAEEARPEMYVPAGFVVGVQPIRGAPALEGFPQAPHVHPVTPMMGVSYGQPPAVGTVAASPRAMHAPVKPVAYDPGAMGRAPMQHASPVHVRVSTGAPKFAQPVGHQLQVTEAEEAEPGSRVGRFAWFVFGAAFGIFFAFFATSFVGRMKRDEPSFPAPAQLPVAQPATTILPPAASLPVQVAPAIQTAAPQVQPQAQPSQPAPSFAQPAMQPPAAMPTPTASQLPAPPVVQPFLTMPVPAQLAPAQPYQQQPPPTYAAPSAVSPSQLPAAQPTARTVSAPGPRAPAPRWQRPAPRRAAPTPAARSASDDTPPAREKSEAVGDMLNAGLGN